MGLTPEMIEELKRQAQNKPEIKQLNDEISRLRMICDVLEGHGEKWHIKPTKH